MQILLQDLRYGLRMLLKNPSFTLVAVFTLALGIGANTAIFSLVYGIVLKPLPYVEQDRLVQLASYNPGGGLPGTSIDEISDWRRESKSFEDIVAYTLGYGVLQIGDERIKAEYAPVSSNFFSVLKISPLLGRAFNPDGDDRAAILSYDFWQKHFGGDSSVINQSVFLNDRQHSLTIIGVMPPDFRFPDDQPRDIWKLSDEKMESGSRNFRNYHTVARLKPGVKLEQAQNEMNAIAAGLEQAYPEMNKNWRINVILLFEAYVGYYRSGFLLLLGSVGFLLLIACANIASLFLARSTSRQKEMAIRAALGASRWRLIRQTLTESMLVGLIGGGAGLLFAVWGLSFLVAMVPDYVPRVSNVRIDRLILSFALVISVITGLLCGLVPAWQAGEKRLDASLKEGGRGLAGAGRQWLHNVLVVLEVALTLVLLVGAGLMLNSFVRLANENLGFNSEGILTASVTLPPDRQIEPAQRSQYFRQVLERVEKLPGIEKAGLATGFPGRGFLGSYPINPKGRVQQPSDKPFFADFRACSGDYFSLLEVPLFEGRFFTAQDILNGPKVAVINQTLAKQLLPNEYPIGKIITLPPRLKGRFAAEEVQIVGVIGDLKQFGPRTKPRPEVYVPYEQLFPFFAHLVVRTRGNPANFAAAIRDEIRAVDKDLFIEDVMTMNQALYNWVAKDGFFTFILATFAALALLLAAVGIYGVMSYSVSSRTQEIGVRRALGAQATDIMKMIVGRGLVLTLIGVAIGIGASLALGRFIKALLYGVSAAHLMTFAGVVLLLTFIAFVACYLPARRAMKVDPIIALRCE